jgi:hypothetical protein
VNREQRRHPETPDGADRRDRPLRTEPQTESERPQEVGSVRAKNTGHKKKTADKWTNDPARRVAPPRLTTSRPRRASK